MKMLNEVYLNRAVGPVEMTEDVAERLGLIPKIPRCWKCRVKFHRWASVVRHLARAHGKRSLRGRR